MRYNLTYFGINIFSLNVTAICFVLSYKSGSDESMTKAYVSSVTFKTVNLQPHIYYTTYVGDYNEGIQ